MMWKLRTDTTEKNSHIPLDRSKHADEDTAVKMQTIKMVIRQSYGNLHTDNLKLF